jgi:tetratricopeptide (TPR) repeat protein
MLGLGVHFLHAYQIKRNAGVFLDLADREEMNGNKSKAIEYLQRYLVYNPDNNETQAKRAILIAEQAVSFPRFESIRDAILLCDQVLRESPDRHDVRRKTVILKLRLGRFNEALEEVEKIIVALPDDGELFDLQGQCQFHANGSRFRVGGAALAPGELSWNIQGLMKEISNTDLDYQKNLERAYTTANAAFQTAIMKDSTRIAAYERRAYLNQFVRERFLELEKTNDKESERKDPSPSAKAKQEADQSIFDMVANNPGAHDAYLNRIQYRKAFASPKDVTDKAWNQQNLDDLKMARELAPDNESVLLASAEQAFDAGDSNSARTFLEKGVELYPKDTSFYRVLARLEFAEKNPDKAVGWMRRYVDAEPNNPFMRWRVA